MFVIIPHASLLLHLAGSQWMSLIARPRQAGFPPCRKQRGFQPRFHEHPGVTTRQSEEQRSIASAPANESVRLGELHSVTDGPAGASDLTLLQEASIALASIASQAGELPGGVITTQALDLVEQALVSMRHALIRPILPEGESPQRRSYQLIDTELAEVLTRLHLRQPAVASIRARRGARQKLDLIMCLLGQRDANGSLFIAVVGAGHGTIPLLSEVPPDWAQHRLGLAQDEATMVTALIDDLRWGLAESAVLLI